MLYGHPIPHVFKKEFLAVVQPADVPSPKSARFGLHFIAHKLLFISIYAEGRRLS